jgi:UDP-N-acetylmuramoylalanine--D-glutamate ligase
LLNDLTGKRVTVFGLGREGADLARFLVAERARVLVTERRSIEQLGEELRGLDGLDLQLVAGGHPPEQVLEADLLFVSPGIPPTTPVLVEADRRGIPRSSATELFFARCLAPIIGITGSSGKSTTTALTGEILKAAGQRVVVGGNIGYPLLGRLHELDGDSVVVMELSSFQLETVEPRPAVATITNITPNHLDRHGTMSAYIAAKERIYRFQGSDDWTVLNADDAISRGLQPPARVARFSLEHPVDGAYLDGERLVLSFEGRRREVCNAADVALRGRHNLANALTACLTAGLAGAEPDAMRAALGSFRGMPHRLQWVGQIGGVSFYDDSIATSPERSMAGLASFHEPIVLLAGGRDKHLPMDEWATMIRERVGAVVLFGEARGLIRAALEHQGYPASQLREVDSIPSAVRTSLELAAPGDVVLLSPGCTSYDMFRDFVERGQVFAAAVREQAENIP